MLAFIVLRYLSDHYETAAQKELGPDYPISTNSDILGDAYEYLIGQFAAGSGKKAGEFYTPQAISTILSHIVTLDSQNPATGQKKKLNAVLDFACGSGSLLLNVCKQMGSHGIGIIDGQEKNITTYNLDDHINTVIGLPANLFFSTGIPAHNFRPPISRSNRFALVSRRNMLGRP